MKSVSVKKFGGTSVGSIERIERVADRLCESYKNGERFVVVASAMSGETNRLVQLAHDIHPKARGGEAYDLLLASGEQVSISLLTLALLKRGVPASPLLAFQLGIKTNSIYSKARIQNIKAGELKALLEEDKIPVVAGFQGINDKDKVTTLGRGGSDTTAVALAAALEADVCEIFTDVDGVYSTDPRIEPNASKIKTLSYEEMMEMASLGSKVLHFRCVEIGAKYNVPIHVRSTFVMDEGTWIINPEKSMEAPVVSAITHDPKVTILAAEPAPEGVDFLSKLFGKLSEKEVLIDIISQMKGDKGQRVAFSLPDEDIDEAQSVLKSFLTSDSEITVIKHASKVSIVGVGMKTHPGVAARFFKALNKADISVSLVTTSDIKVSAVIEREKTNDAVRALHEEFDLSKSS